MQGQHLIQGGLVGNQLDADQILPGSRQRVLIHAQPLAEAAIRVVAESLGVSHGEQKQIKRGGSMAAAINMAVTNQTLVDPAELFGDLADTICT